MKKLTLACFGILLLTICCNIQSSIYKFTIFERLHEHGTPHYIIKCLHDEHPNVEQVQAIKYLIDADSENIAMFLFSDPFFIDTQNVLALQAQYSAPRNMQTNVMCLLEYAFIKSKLALNIDTFLFGILEHLRNKNIGSDIKNADIANLVMHHIYLVEEEVKLIRKKLDEAEDPFLNKGLQLYISYYEKIQKSLESCKADMDELLSPKYDDFDQYLSERYPAIKNIRQRLELFFLTVLVVYPNVNFLNSFKAILENQQTSRIFLFLNSFPEPEPNILEHMLCELGYEKVHTYSSETIEESIQVKEKIFSNIRDVVSTGGTFDFSLIASWMQEVLLAEHKMRVSVPAEEFYSLMTSELSSALFGNTYININHVSDQVSMSQDSISLIEALKDAMSYNDFSLDKDRTRGGKEKEI